MLLFGPVDSPLFLEQTGLAARPRQRHLTIVVDFEGSIPGQPSLFIFHGTVILTS